MKTRLRTAAALLLLAVMMAGCKPATSEPAPTPPPAGIVLGGPWPRTDTVIFRAVVTDPRGDSVAAEMSVHFEVFGGPDLVEVVGDSTFTRVVTSTLKPSGAFDWRHGQANLTPEYPVRAVLTVTYATSAMGYSLECFVTTSGDPNRLLLHNLPGFIPPGGGVVTKTCEWIW